MKIAKGWEGRARACEGGYHQMVKPARGEQAPGADGQKVDISAHVGKPGGSTGVSGHWSPVGHTLGMIYHLSSTE